MGVLDGQVAMVTGAASGIGAAIVDAYLAEGARVVLADRDESALVAAVERHAAVGGLVSAVAGRRQRPEQTKTMVNECLDAFGRIDILVNCAGILTEVPLVEMDVATWDEMIAVDLRSVFLCCRWAAPHMVGRGSGRIINIASQLGIKGGVGLVHYSAAKAGVIGLTKALARELAPDGVLVNAIAPGPIETPHGRRDQRRLEGAPSEPNSRSAGSAGRMRWHRRRSCWPTIRAATCTSARCSGRTVVTSCRDGGARETLLLSVHSTVADAR